jgi:hypothetical protein
MKRPPARLIQGIGRSLDSLSLIFRLSHRAKDRIYWTKVSINTFVSVVHWRCRPTIDETIVWLVSGPVKMRSTDTLVSINTFVQ